MDLTVAFTALVGKEENPYVFHRSIAAKSSDFFASAAKGDWKEAHEKTVKLPDVETELFDLYIHWSYFRTTPLPHQHDASHNDVEASAMAESNCATLMRLYVLGYYLHDREFRNVVVTLVLDIDAKTGLHPGTAMIRIFWDATPANCPMKQMLLRFWALAAGREDISNDLPPEFALRLLLETFSAYEEGQNKPQYLIEAKGVAGAIGLSEIHIEISKAEKIFAHRHR